MRHRVFVAVFFLLLLAPALSALFGVRGRVVENRPPSERPAFAPARLLDAGYYAALADWLRDALPLRAEGIAVDAWIDYRLLGDSPSPELLVGEDGELFLTESLRLPCERPADPERILAGVGGLGRTLARAEIDLYLMLSPNKHALHPERLPASARAAARCAELARETLRAPRPRGDSFVLVDVWTPFERSLQEGREIFPKLGRHWNDHASILQARALIEAIEPGLWNDARRVSEGEEQRPAELPERFMNLAIPETHERLRIERPGVHVRAERFRVARESKRAAWRRLARSEGPHLLPGLTLVIGDSFVEDSIDPLAPFTQDLVYVHWRDAWRFLPQTATLVARAERVVLQAAEDRRGVIDPKELARLRLALMPLLAERASAR